MQTDFILYYINDQLIFVIKLGLDVAQCLQLHRKYMCLSTLVLFTYAHHSLHVILTSSREVR